MHLFIYLHTHIHLSIYLLHSKKLLFNNLFMAGLKWTQNNLYIKNQTHIRGISNNQM